MMRALKNERGQELAELAITLVLFLLLALSIVEFGRMLMIASMVTHAARDGARMAAVEPATNRDGNGDHHRTVAAINARVERSDRERHGRDLHAGGRCSPP